jgi:hypothetical protein
MAAAHVRGQRGFALAAVAAAHAGLFLLLALGLRPVVRPSEQPVSMVPVYLLETRRRERAQRPLRSQPRTLAVHPRPAVDLPPVPATPAPERAQTSTPSDSDAVRTRLAGALRASRVGCANLALLTERERARCEDRLAAGAATAKYIPTPLPPERRAYYDAVAKAKQPLYVEPMRPGEHPVPEPRSGGGSSLAALQAKNEKFRAPIVGCKVAFGSGARKPPHGMKLGPVLCAVPLPQGPLTVEADIENPDKVVRRKD